jgi:S-adenosylmethionine/arginine decarboxylase-like enzyme
MGGTSRAGSTQDVARRVGTTTNLDGDVMPPMVSFMESLSPTSFAPRVLGGEEFVDLAPAIVRQRMVIEGTTDRKIGTKEIVSYLAELSDVIGMITLIDPVTHKSDLYGWAGWIHWETSGAHFYAWDDIGFFSVDIYACKTFDAHAALSHTQKTLSPTRMVSREL